MNAEPTTVLLIEGNPADAAGIEHALSGSPLRSFQVTRAACLSEAMVQLGRSSFAVVLLDLNLSDGHGRALFEQILVAAPKALTLVLCTAGDEAIARWAVQHGALDSLVKGQGDERWLPRALHHLIERRSIADALRDSEARFRAINDALPLGIFVSDMRGHGVYANPAYLGIAGLCSEQAAGAYWISSIHPEDRPRVQAEWQAALLERAPFETECRFLRGEHPEDRAGPGGHVVWVRVHSAEVPAGPSAQRRVQTVEDISARKSVERGLQRAEMELFEEKERAQVTLNSIGDAVLATDARGRLSYLNAAAEEMVGWTAAEALGQLLETVFNIVDSTTREVTANPAKQAIAEDRTIELASNCVLVRRDGSESAIEDSAAPIHDRDGVVTGAVIVFRDVSESRFMTLKLAHLAQHDFLTGLPNRLLLTERLNQAIGQALRHRRQVALLFVDLDHFKNINDSLGHGVGDELLRSASARLAAGVRTTDTVCRQGGDEFVILLAEIGHPHEAAQIAEKLRVAIAEPHVIAGRELHVSLSIGISVFPDDGATAEILMQNADTAMYHAKACGRDNTQFYMAEMNARAVRRMALDKGLRRAMKQGEFVLHYQSKVNLSTGRLTGIEALIRWQDPTLGLVLPLDFVPMAEESGLIVPIGRWVLHEACRQLQEWRNAGYDVMPVAVNISAVEFRQKGFLTGLKQILAETGLPAQDLELELTESMLMHDAEASVALLVELKAMGIQLAIDDFGTGYSSLNYLKRFPIDVLKIDQSFIRDITTDVGNAKIVSAVIGMGRNLNQRVVAEGIETDEQLALLKAQQCEEGQGFQFSHPLPAEEFAMQVLGPGQASLSGHPLVAAGVAESILANP